MNAWETLESKYLLERPWMNLRADRVQLPSGAVLDEFHVVEYPDWSCVCALTEDGRMVLVEQYRHGVARSSLELPAGEVGSAEDPLEAAKRELLEETGYEATEWQFVGRCAPNPSKHTSYAHLFVARGARRVRGQELDEGEDIVVRLMECSAVLSLAEEGGMTHGIHIMAVFWAARKGLIE